jgi:hypothetical protein
VQFIFFLQRRFFIMTTKNFVYVYGIVELGTEIMKELAAPSLLALSYTSKSHYILVHQYLRYKLGRIMAQFDVTPNQILKLLRMTKAIVIGSVALQAVSPATLPITSSQLDIIIPVTELFMFEDWFKLSRQYKVVPSVHHFRWLPPVVLFVSLGRCINQQKRVVNLIVVEKPAHAYQQMINYSPNTAEMNAITGVGLFMPYRSLLSQGLAAHNHVANIEGVQQSYPSVQIRVFKAAIISQLTMLLRGFAFIEGEHWNYNCCCSDSSACPYQYRNTNDNYCAFMRILTDKEWSTLESDGQQALPIANPRIPMVIWRLADKLGGGRGFSVVFC